MIGIKDFGIYIPKYRLQKGKLTRSVGNFDEDSTTMAIQASMNIKEETKNTDALFYSTNSPTYGEKQEGAFIATILNLKEDCFTLDIAKSLRGAVDGVINGYNSIISDQFKEVLVAAADTRKSEAGSIQDYGIGDGACSAKLCKSDDVIYEIIGYSTIYDEIVSTWRYESEKTLKHSDGKYLREYDYALNTSKVVKKVLEKAKIDVGDVKRFIFPLYDIRAKRIICKQLNIDEEKIYSTQKHIGFIGTAQPLFDLIMAIKEVEENDIVILTGFGDGSSALALRVNKVTNETIKRIESIEKQLNAYEVISFDKYLKFKNVLKDRDIEGIDPFTSPIVLSREKEMNYRLKMQKCNQCGAIQIPQRRICWKCKSKDDFAIYIPSKKGKIFALTSGYLFPTVEEATTMVLINISSGGNIILMLTETPPSAIKIGDEVIFVLRKMYDNKGYRNYYWKAKKEKN